MTDPMKRKPKLSPIIPWRKPPIGVIVHTTGAGVHVQGKAHGMNGFDWAHHLYMECMQEGPHYLISQLGEVEVVQPLDLVAYHVGTVPYNKLAAPVTQREYNWWRAAFPDFKKVGDHPLWRVNGSVNKVAYGIEVVPPEADANGPWSDDAVDSLADTLASLPLTALVRGITVATHSEVSPYTRTAKGLPWDLPPAQAAQLDEIVGFLRKNRRTV